MWDSHFQHLTKLEHITKSNLILTCDVWVLRSTSNHTRLKWRCMFKTSNEIGHVCLRRLNWRSFFILSSHINHSKWCLYFEQIVQSHHNTRLLMFILNCNPCHTPLKHRWLINPLTHLESSITPTLRRLLFGALKYRCSNFIPQAQQICIWQM